MTDTEVIQGRNPASFRDPSGYVFGHGRRLFRAIDEATHQTIRELQRIGLWDRLIDSGRLVRTRLMDEAAWRDELMGAAPGFSHFLEHERIEQISYPYEWSPSMLADAGVATLDLQIELLQHGYSLKDATAYNIQFVNGRPVFLDIPSIERPERLDVWIALGQFGRMFTSPLLLHRRKGHDLRSYFLAHLDGSDVRDVQRAFGRWELLKPGLVMDITLPWLMSRMSDRSNDDTREQTIAGKETSPAAQIINLRRLRAKLTKLGRATSSFGPWADYTQTCGYSEVAEAAKTREIAACLEQTEPREVLDIGCNTGRYARLAAGHGARVVALDSDTECVDRLYRQVRIESLPILPLRMDIANPSPAIGFCNRERPAFFERFSADCVFALALIHHLHVSANLPLAGIRDMFADLTRRDLVLEFVPSDDVMFRKLMRFRRDLYGDYTLDRCIAVFRGRFDLQRRVDIPETTRTLLFLRKREVQTTT